jgi:hypothetical protein
MRKLLATIAAALALGGVGLAAHSTTSDPPDDALFPRRSTLEIMMRSARL